MRKRAGSSLLLRYLISYGAVLGVLILGICLYTNAAVRTTTRRNIVDSNINRLGVLRVQHEEKLSALLDISTQIGFSPDIAPFRFMDDPMKAYYLKQKLAAYNTVTSFYKQMYLLFDEDRYLYSMSTSVSLPMFVEQMFLLEHEEPPRLQDFIRGATNGPAFLPLQKTQSIFTGNADMSVVNVPLRMNGRTHIGNLVFLIPDTAYQQMFSDSVYEPRNMYIIHENRILSAVRRIEGVEDEDVLSALERSGQPAQTVTIGAARYLLFLQNGGALGVKYASLVPENAVGAQTAQSLLVFGLILLLILVPCLALAVNFSRRFVKPIRDIRNTLHTKLGQRPAAEGAGTDHFAAIRDGIERLGEENSLLHRRLDNSLDARAADFVRHFVKCRFGTAEAAEAAAAGLGLAIGRSVYAISVLSAAGFSQWYGEQGADSGGGGG